MTRFAIATLALFLAACSKPAPTVDPAAYAAFLEKAAAEPGADVRQRRPGGRRQLDVVV